MLEWLDDDRLPCTWAGAFYATVRALCLLVAYLTTLAVFGTILVAIIGAQLQ
jgi:hypothetical protein